MCLSSLAGSKAWRVDLGVFLVEEGGLGWWQVLLETWRKLASPAIFFPCKDQSLAPLGWGERRKLNQSFLLIKQIK